MEAALKIREKVGGKISVLSMTPPFSADRIKECLAMGADEGYMVSDVAFAGADTFSTSYTLMKAIEKMGEKPDLILAGNESADGATAHVPAQLAEWLGIPHITNIKEISVEEDGLFRVAKRMEQGVVHYTAEGPVLFSMARGANQPRLISAMGVVKAAKKPLVTWGKEDLDVNPDLIGIDGSPTQAGQLLEPDLSRVGRRLEGEPDQIAEAIISEIKKAGVSL
jgi:electron transfer flavoprotein beta subunit